MSSLHNTLLVIAAVLLSGCWSTAKGTDEVCNGLDDDWDELTDEDFMNDAGEYDMVEHCGGCNINCAEVYPSALSVACEPSDKGRICRITGCPPGTHLQGEVLCVPDAEAQCLSCGTDRDCSAADPAARCVLVRDGDHRCLLPCDGDDDCDGGFQCTELEGSRYCAPQSGHCACTEASAGARFGCILTSPVDKVQCYGEQVCDGTSLSACESLVKERCDAQDNDCDGMTDEDFVVDGLYLDRRHCGACNHPCQELAPNTVAECRAIGGEATCVRECLDNYVDLDGLSLNGCECFKVSSVWPPASLGGDMDCDGTVDSTAEWVFVSKTGDDSNPGTLEAPVLTIGRGVEIAAPDARTIFVAQGTYDEAVAFQSGISIFGGYRSDFGDYNVDLFAVVVRSTGGPPGAPVFVARGIREPSELSGLTLEGSPGAAPGGATTAALIADSDERFVIHDVTIVAGNGTDGANGRSSSEILGELTGESLSSLDGISGGNGEDGFSADTVECRGLLGAGGAGGTKVCALSGVEISGGNGGNASCPDTGCQVGVPCPNGGCDDYMEDGECDYKQMSDAAIPNPPAEDGMGPGGGAGGALTYDAPTIRSENTYCADDPALRRPGGGGGNGAEGENGQGGLGCSDPEGLLDLTTGLWTTGDGTDGTDGTDGAGGGGGTQGNGYDALQSAGFHDGNNSDHLGGAGGGGGSGGCGSPGATGGTGGGSSIGILVTLTPEGQGPEIHHVRILPGVAGDGGDGGIGGAGGAPGAGGTGGEGGFWCARRGGRGGDGGKGGDGGGGGGGCGGSISGFHIVVTGDEEPAERYREQLMNATSVDPLPAPGSGGKGGFSPGASGRNGEGGIAEPYRMHFGL